MFVVMATMSSNKSEWKPGHVPKLSYRNAAPSDGTMQSITDSSNDPIATHAQPVSGVSIRQVREASQARMSTNSSRQTTQQVQKKRPSLFGGLFAKEPSMAALDQVAAQMIGQRGALNAKTIPYVSSQKMPEYVPKVNTKWDGVPEVVKIREKQAKERQRATNRNSLFMGHSSQSRSTDGSNRPPQERRYSNTSSWDSRSTGSRPVFSDNPQRRAESLYSTDSESSGDVRERSTSITSESFRSPSGTSLPAITAFFPNDISEIQQSPNDQPSRGNTYFKGPSLLSEGREQIHLPVMQTDTVPEHSSSPTATPLEQSPRTPLTVSNDESLDVDLKRRGLLVASDISLRPISTSTKSSSIQVSDAFLAGEAKPLEIPDADERFVPDLTCQSLDARSAQWQSISVGKVSHDVVKRPDSSRARLGLRASMVVRTDGTPWEPTITRSVNAQSPQSPSSPRSKFKFFGKDRIP